MRCRPLDDTLYYAKKLAKKFGISRVTETTRLDRAGIPVYASIRPGAMEGSLCVNAGKGLQPREAEVGAYMEAIEFAYAEPNVAGLEVIQTTVGQLLDGASRPGAMLDFCPKLGAQFQASDPIEAINATDLITGKKFLVPAARVFNPYRSPEGFPSFFKYSSNGLASGNSRIEASLHAVFEIIERDISAFQTIKNTTRLLISYPEKFLPLVKRLESNGLRLRTRFAPNDFGIPYFVSYVFDPEWKVPVFITGGFGCHPDREIALMRSITETVQGRMTLIHGSRDDLHREHHPFKGWDPDRKEHYFNEVVKSICDDQAQTGIETVESLQLPEGELSVILKTIVDLLQAKGFKHILQVPLTPAEAPLQVVKVIIPKMEHFHANCREVGQRLSDYAASITQDPVRGA